MEDDLKETLDVFVAEWRRELSSSHPAARLLGKRTAGVEEEEGGGDDEGSLNVPLMKRAVRREPSPLLVLPAARGEKEMNVCAVREEVRAPSPSLLDTLLADLVGSDVEVEGTMRCLLPRLPQDDINTVPFFEVKLPREVALLIFSHLSMADICTCARVWE